MLAIKTGKDLNNEQDFVEACHDIALHTAWCSAKYTYENEVPEEEVAHEREILTMQVQNDPKMPVSPRPLSRKSLVIRSKIITKKFAL